MTIRIRFEVTYGMAMAKKPSRSSDSSEPASNTSWLEAITVEVRVEEPFRGAMRGSARRLIRIFPTKSTGISLTSRPGLLSTADAETQEAIRPNWAP